MSFQFLFPIRRSSLSNSKKLKSEESSLARMGNAQEPNQRGGLVWKSSFFNPKAYKSTSRGNYAKHSALMIIKQIRIWELAHKDGCADCSASAPFQRSIARSAATLLRARIGVYVHRWRTRYAPSVRDIVCFANSDIILPCRIAIYSHSERV